MSKLDKILGMLTIEAPSELLRTFIIPIMLSMRIALAQQQNFPLKCMDPDSVKYALGIASSLMIVTIVVLIVLMVLFMIFSPFSGLFTRIYEMLGARIGLFIEIIVLYVFLFNGITDIVGSINVGSSTCAVLQVSSDRGPLLAKLIAGFIPQS